MVRIFVEKSLDFQLSNETKNIIRIFFHLETLRSRYFDDID